MTGSNLFSPLPVGSITLGHRVAMAPLTRLRSPKHVPTDLVAEYYEQRASTPGTLLITEATFIAPQAGGYPNVPGIWSEEQVAAWKKVFDRVHAKGSYAYVQLWALGRQADPKHLEAEGYPYVSASDVPMDTPFDVKSKESADSEPASAVKPRPLTKEEIKEYIQLYVVAAKNAIAAGADGVEIHSANGYLLDQFLHECTNHRTDEYGGSIENRARFVLEVVDAVVAAVGADKVGIRFSPWNTFGSVDFGVSPVPQWSYVLAQLEERAQKNPKNRLAFVHVVEPRVTGHLFSEKPGDNSFVRSVWHGVYLRAGGLVDAAEETADSDPQTVVVIGRSFISNPDLPARLQNRWPLTPYNRDLFYASGPEGYTDYEFYQKN